MAVPSITKFPLPRLSDSMEEGTVIKWLKRPVDAVTLGEPPVEIETDKASMVHESDAAGTLLEVVAPEGATVAVGEVIARIGPPDEFRNVGAS
jgi:pyruvate dehydrogenase E2 component (dihydrolipoamide acetyltransferase)